MKEYRFSISHRAIRLSLVGLSAKMPFIISAFVWPLWVVPQLPHSVGPFDFGLCIVVGIFALAVVTLGCLFGYYFVLFVALSVRKIMSLKESLARQVQANFALLGAYAIPGMASIIIGFRLLAYILL